MLRYILLGVLPFSVLSACGNAPSVQEVNDRTMSLVKGLLVDGTNVLDQAARHEAIRSLIEGLRGVAGDDQLATNVWPEQPEVPGETIRIKEEAPDYAAEIEKWLAENLFNEASVAGHRGDTTTFRLRGEVVCRRTVGDSPVPVPPPGAPDPAPLPAPKPATTEIDPECQAKIDELDIRIDATPVGDGMLFALRLGEVSGVIAELELRPGAATLRVHLAAARAAAQRVAQVMDEQLDLPTVMQGVLAASLIISGPDEAELKLVAEEAIDVQGTHEAQPYWVKIAASDPLLGIHFKTGEVTMSASWGLTDLLLPGDLFPHADEVTMDGPADPRPAPLNKPIKLLLPGMNARVKAVSNGTLTVEHLDLGQARSELWLGADLLAALDLNPEDGRSLSLTVAPWQELPSCSVGPKLDLRLELNLGLLDPYSNEPAPAWAARERYQLLLASTAGEAQVGILEDTGTVGAQPLLQVLKGTLTIQSAVTAKTVTVEQGSCLIRSEQEGEPASLVELLGAGACAR